MDPYMQPTNSTINRKKWILCWQFAFGRYSKWKLIWIGNIGCSRLWMIIHLIFLYFLDCERNFRYVSLKIIDTVYTCIWLLVFTSHLLQITFNVICTLCIQFFVSCVMKRYLLVDSMSYEILFFTMCRKVLFFFGIQIMLL